MIKRDFLIIPAVDIKGGKCVRLWRGQAEQETVFEEDPLNAAVRWQEEGAGLLHVVDLDGAFAGEPVNDSVIKRIAGALEIPVEVGGGIRSTTSAASYIESGVARVIVGTAAFKEPEWLEQIAHELQERLVVGLDVTSGKVAVHGWLGVSEEEPEIALSRLTEAGVRRVIYTDTLTDGTLAGPNFEGIRLLAKRSKIPVIASGGVASIEDILKIESMCDLGVEGVITGVALYRREFSLRDAIAALGKRSV